MDDFSLIIVHLLLIYLMHLQNVVLRILKIEVPRLITVRTKRTRIVTNRRSLAWGLIKWSGRRKEAVTICARAWRGIELSSLKKALSSIHYSLKLMTLIVLLF